jgi:hypothetical protein
MTNNFLVWCNNKHEWEVEAVLKVLQEAQCK